MLRAHLPTLNIEKLRLKSKFTLYFLKYLNTAERATQNMSLLKFEKLKNIFMKGTNI